MELIGVIDLMNGVVVHGVAGRRREYRPVASRLCSTAEPVAVARALVEQLGIRELYLADLDAIGGQLPAWEHYDALTRTGAHLWVDAGIRTAAEGLALARRGIECVVAGLETVSGPDVVEALANELGDRLVFSLDLRGGVPLGTSGSWADPDGRRIAVEAIERGVRRLLVLDLARVGVGEGTGTEDLCAWLAASHPDVAVIAGGGVRGRDDLLRLRACGVAGVLVASAFHDGRLTREDVNAFR